MKTHHILCAILGLGGLAHAVTDNYTTLATMDTLVQAGTIIGTPVRDNTLSGTVYTFDGNSAITDISNSAMANAITGRTGYLTVAAWVYNGGGSNTNIFSTGGQTNGFKLDLKNDALLFTTKNVKDTALSAAAVADGQWTLVGFCLNLTGSGNSWLYDGAGSTRHYTCQLGNWNAANPATFAIGSGNSNGIRLDDQGRSEAFIGSIANLQVLYSTDLLSNAAMAQAVGEMPTALPAVPEPRAALLGLLAVAWVAARRRRR